tara:strand:+ start:456 stop:2840 length:2385 start_codon:yes stop_codon:yes gene_type:complete
MKNRAIILGAGPSGLVTAWKLLENNWDVEVYEKLKLPGGMCRSWKWGEHFVDTGPHIFHTHDKSLENFWKKEFGDLLQEGSFWCKNVQGENYDQLWDYPLSWESISNYPENIRKKIMEEVKNLSPEDSARAKSFDEYIHSLVGNTLFKMFFSKYPKKIWGIESSEMTAEWAPKRIEIRQKILPFFHGQFSAVGKFGTGSVYERIKEKIISLGGKIFFEETINKINTMNNDIVSLETLSGKNINLTTKDKCISTIPITLTANLLGLKTDLRFRGIKSIYLKYKEKNIIPDNLHWLYYDNDKVFFNRITETKKMSPQSSPVDETILTAEITFSKGDKIDMMETKDLEKMVEQQVLETGLTKGKKFIESSSNTENFVYPVQTKGYNQELSKVRSFINKFNQLYSIGTGGEFNYADSQVLFHKAFDIVDILCERESRSNQVIKQINKNNMNKLININSRIIGDGNNCYIIAEIGLNHNNSIKIAKELIDHAVVAGCDAVKFQTYDSDSRVSNKVKSARYADKTIGLEETIGDMFNRLRLDEMKHKEIFEYARSKNIEVFSTPFDEVSLEFLESLNVNLYKIASMDIVNLELIRKVALTKKPIILSCGMSTLGQVEDAVNTVKETGNVNLMLLHCNSSYPASHNEMNLNVISTLKKNFQVPVGLSDHTFGLLASHTAIAIGANLIERHFTLDRSMQGPDHILSSEPGEMIQLVKISKMMPELLGDGIKRIQPNEYVTLNTQRKSIYTNSFIKKGEKITKEKIIIKGPAGGLLPKYLEIVVGRIAQKDIPADHPIKWENI